VDPLIAFNQLLPPVASDLYADDRIETLNAVYTSVTRQIVTSVIPILAVLVVYGRELLGLFGEPYVAGYAPSSSTSAGCSSAARWARPAGS